MPYYAEASLQPRPKSAQVLSLNNYCSHEFLQGKKRNGCLRMESENYLSKYFERPQRRVTVRKVVKSSTAIPKRNVTSKRPSSSELTVVVACYNGATRLRVGAFLDFLGDCPPARIVFVNDGSRDRTLAILNWARAEMSDRIDVIDLRAKQGKAEVVRQGLIFATNRGDALLAYWDADLATLLYALQDFTRIAARFSDVEMFFESRRKMLGHRIERTFARLALRLPIDDTRCGAKLLRNSNALRGGIAAPFTAGWLFDVVLFARVADRKRASYEIPLAAWSEIPGSKVSARAVVRSRCQMLGVIVRNRLQLGLTAPCEAPNVAGQLVTVDTNVTFITQSA